MCVVSMVGDQFNDRYKPQVPSWFPDSPPLPMPGPYNGPLVLGEPKIGRAEFEALKREVLLMKELLTRAKAYDVANNEPNCELEEKVALLKAIAKAVGVDLEDVFGK